MSLISVGSEPQPSLAWQFEGSNVDSVTNLSPSSTVQPGIAQLQGTTAIVYNAPTSNTAVNFPGGSGNNMNLGSGSPAAVNVSTSNLYVEVWVYPRVLSGFGSGLIGSSQYGQQWVFHMNNAYPHLWVNGPVGTDFTSTIPTNSWSHIAFSWALGPSSNTAYFFINGVASGSVNSTTPVAATPGTPYIGDVNGNTLNGYIRDLRVIQGGIVPTTGFTVASAPFSYSLPSYVTGSGSVVFTLLGQFVSYNSSGKYGSSIYFNNQNATSSGSANVSVTYNISSSGITANNASYSLWIKPYYSFPVAGLGQTAFRFTDSQTVYELDFNSGVSQNQLFFYASSSPGVTITTGVNLTTQTWYHYAVSLSNVNMTGSNTSASFYFNGTQYGTTSNVARSGISLIQTVVLAAGGAGGSNGFWCEIDDLRIYNKALTSTQVQSIYTQGGAAASSFQALPQPVLAWQFEGSLTESVQGLTPITPVQPSFTNNYAQMVSNAPTSNIAVYFPGNTLQYLSLQGTLNSVNLNTTNVFAESLVYINSLTPSISIIFARGQKSNYSDWWMGVNSSGVFQAGVQNTLGTVFTASTTSSLTTGSWNHVAFSYVSSTSTLYAWLNGGSLGTATLTGTANTNSSLSVLSGWDGGTNYLNGYIRDIRFISGGVVPTLSTFTPTTAPWGFAQASYVTNMGATTYAYPSQTYSYSTGLNGRCLNLVNPASQSVYPNNYVVWSVSLSTLGYSVSSPYAYSVSLWFNPSTVNTYQQMFTTFGFNPEGDFRLDVNGSSISYGYINTPGLNGINSSTFSLNKWSHVVATLYESSSNCSISLYLNGVFQGTSTGSGNPRSLSRMALGAFCDGQLYPFPFVGLVDDLRVYNTALSAAQVQAIYNAQGVSNRGVQQVSSGYLFPLPTYISSNVTGTNITGSTLQPFSFGNASIYMNTDPNTYITWSAATLSSTTNFTLETWTNYKDFTNASSYWNGGGKVPCLFNETSTTTLGFFYFGPTIAGTVGLYYWSGSQDIYAESSITIAVNTWNHIALTYDGTTYRIFINGVLAATNTKTGFGMSLTNGLRIGSHKLTIQSPNANVRAYIASSRFVTGAIVYPTSSTTLGTTVFTPPTAPLTTYSSGTTTMLLNVTQSSGTLTGTPLFSQLSTSATSSAVGAFSLRAVNGTTARAVQVQARPVVVYPPAAMGSNTSTISSQSYGNGTYIASSSSVNNGSEYCLFDKNNTTYYIGTSGTYNITTGVYVGSNSTTISSVSILGEWVQLQSPTSFILRNYTITQRSGAWQQTPTTFWIAGSNDGTTWSNVNQQTGLTFSTTGGPGINITVPQTSNSLAYSYYRLVATVVGNSTDTNFRFLLAFIAWDLYGDSVSYTTGSSDFYADRLGNLLTAPVTGQTLTNWLGGATGYVTTWYDQSGKGNHATQATAANQPIIQRATKGPGYMLVFSGSQYLTGFSYTILNNTNYTVCTVNRRTANSGGGNPYQSDNPIVGCGTNTSATNGCLHITYRSGNVYLHAQYSNDQYVTISAFTAASTEPIRYTFSMCSTTSSRNAYVYNDPLGAPIKQQWGSTAVLSMTGGNLLIGTIAVAQPYFIGEMYEIILLTTSLYDTDGTTGSNVPTSVQTIYQNQLAYTGT